MSQRNLYIYREREKREGGVKKDCVKSKGKRELFYSIPTMLATHTPIYLYMEHS